MPVSLVATSTAPLKPFIAGRNAITPGTWRGWRIALAVEKLRKEYPKWGKDNLVVLLHRRGFNCAASTVGRIISRLKARGVLKEPVINHVSAHRRGITRPYAVRKPKDYQVSGGCS